MQLIRAGLGCRLRAAVVGAMLALLLGYAPGATAASLNLVPVPPDIYSVLVGVNYNAATDTLTASGTAVSLDFDGVAPPDRLITGGTLAINATVNDAGVLSGGTIAIGGTIPALGYNSGSLLTGSLSQIGFPTTGVGGNFDPLEFLFSATGGDLAPLYDAGPSNGIILSFSGYPGSWASNFTNIRNGAPHPGVADVFAPLPGAVWLLGSGLAVMLGFGARRRTAA